METSILLISHELSLTARKERLSTSTRVLHTMSTWAMTTTTTQKHLIQFLPHCCQIFTQRHTHTRRLWHDYSLLIKWQWVITKVCMLSALRRRRAWSCRPWWTGLGGRQVTRVNFTEIGSFLSDFCAFYVSTQCSTDPSSTFCFNHKQF